MSDDDKLNELPPQASPEKAGLLTVITESFGLSSGVGICIMVLSCLAVISAVFFFIHSAPPNTITITSGPEGSVFYTNAVKYSVFLERKGIKVNIRPSHGSIENLQRLADPSIKVDVGFVQGGVTNGITDELVSLGSISYQPLLVFYRGTPIETLAELAGKRLAVGPVGSGTRTLVLSLLETNGIKSGESTTLLDIESQDASKAIVAGSIDAVFLMGEDASPAVMRKLLLAPDIHLMSFAQAEAYTRRFGFLSVLKLPQGGIDLGRNIPTHDVYLIGPTVELIARKDLHPALSDLLLGAAREIHGKASLLQHKNEFPAPLEHDIHISADAARYYKSGTSFFYRYLPFWLASLTSRIVVFFIPTVVLLIPILRSIPHLYRWRTQMRIYGWYRALLVLERNLSKDPAIGKDPHRFKRLDEIARSVNKIKVPASLADQFYSLRGHIDYVRQLMTNK